MKQWNAQKQSKLRSKHGTRNHHQRTLNIRVRFGSYTSKMLIKRWTFHDSDEIEITDLSQHFGKHLVILIKLFIHEHG